MWYDKYISLYGKSVNDIPDSIFDDIKSRLIKIQNEMPLVSVVVIAHNEETHLLPCLWSLSNFLSKYPMEIICVNNNSNDETESIFKRLGVQYYNETRQGPGFARQCGLDKAKGHYYFCIDADTVYPPHYIDLMMEKLTKPGVACVNAFWSFFSDNEHSRIGLFFYETIRDLFLWVQHFKRPELCVRGMVFAFNADFARHVGFRTDIRRGEDGSMAFSLKPFGKITFLYSRKARPMTGYGTLGSQSLLRSFLERVIIQGKGILRVFYKKEKYEDTDENLIKSDCQ